MARRSRQRRKDRCLRLSVPSAVSLLPDVWILEFAPEMNPAQLHRRMYRHQEFARYFVEVAEELMAPSMGPLVHTGRKFRGRQLAPRVERMGDDWYIPSSTGVGGYIV